MMSNVDLVQAFHGCSSDDSYDHDEGHGRYCNASSRNFEHVTFTQKPLRRENVMENMGE